MLKNQITSVPRLKLFDDDHGNPKIHLMSGLCQGTYIGEKTIESKPS